MEPHPPATEKPATSKPTKMQNEANRRNSQLSTGPRTPEGKDRSSRNALKHGLTARQIVLPSESAADFELLRDAIHAHLAPDGPIENLLVDQIVAAAWRLRRSRVLETRFFHQRVDDLEEKLESYDDPADSIGLVYRYDATGSRALDNLSRFETRIERALYRALHELERRQARRNGQPVPLPIAADIDVTLSQRTNANS